MSVAAAECIDLPEFVGDADRSIEALNVLEALDHSLRTGRALDVPTAVRATGAPWEVGVQVVHHMLASGLIEREGRHRRAFLVPGPDHLFLADVTEGAHRG